MAEASRDDWERYREFSRQVFGFDPGPRPTDDVQVDRRQVRKESRSVRTTLSAEAMREFDVPADELREGESVEVTQIAGPFGLFLPWADFRDAEGNGKRKG